jgi:GTPase Era involved in 16S rRNA processing
MKNIYFIFLFSIFLFSKVKAQNNTTEIVLGIPECYQTIQEWNKVKTALQTMNGIEVKGVCTRHDCIILQVNRTLIPTNQPIFDKIKVTDAKYNIFIKEATFETMMAMCNDETIKPK